MKPRRIDKSRRQIPDRDSRARRRSRLRYAGGAPKESRLSEAVAQLVEHLTFNQVVLGSSPSGLTN